MLSEFPSEPFSGRENNSEQNAATSVFDMTVFKLRVLVEAVRNGRDVAECGRDVAECG
jgi:hypothetical protein